MKWNKKLFTIFMAVGLSASMVFGGSYLNNVAWIESQDSLEIRMSFAGGLPEKYKVFLVRDSLAGLLLSAAFLGADTANFQYMGGAAPEWISVLVENDRGKLVTRIMLPLNQEVPFRGEWKANVFQLVLPNVLPKGKPIWKNPWVYLGVGAVTVGGAVLWLTTSKPPSTKSENIDPPDIELPE